MFSFQWRWTNEDEWETERKQFNMCFLRNNIIKKHVFSTEQKQLTFSSNWQWGVSKQLWKEQWIPFNESERRGYSILYSGNNILGTESFKKRWKELHRYLIMVFIKIAFSIYVKLYRIVSNRITLVKAVWNALWNMIVHLVCRYNLICNSGKSEEFNWKFHFS